VVNVRQALDLVTLNGRASIQQFGSKYAVIMDKKDILRRVDHTLLSQTATWEEIRQILDDGIKYGCASACIPACYVKQAAEYVDGKLPICTVIGFPNGYHTTATKIFETRDAIANGAEEIDMVINIGFLKDKRYDEIEQEIRKVHEACSGKTLKVIIETCLLTDEEKIKMCEIVTNAGAEFIKTSTGFSTAGATFSDVELMRQYVGTNVKVKAAGGISSFADAEKFIELEKQYGANNYKPLDVVVEKADGIWLYDVTGKKYMDYTFDELKKLQKKQVII
jgi:deoxyribose-phosphate aldolase